MQDKKSWWRRPLRIVQTVFREIDIVDYDAPGVIDYLKRVGANVIVVNGGGIISFYDSKVKPHYPNQFRTDEDVLAELVPLAHAADIKVIARIDFRGAKRPVFEEFPEWFSYDANGNPRMTAGLYAACPNSPYRNEHSFKIIREILVDNGVDGIWENAASFGGLCHCKYCQEKYLSDTGHQLPKVEDWEDPSYARYVQWRYNAVEEHAAAMRRVIDACGEDKAYLAEIPGPNSVRWSLQGGLDISTAGQYFDFMACPCFVIGRDSYGSLHFPSPIYGSVEVAKYLNTIGNGRTGVVLYSHLEQTSRYTAEPETDLRVWMAGTIAGGGSFWDCTFLGHHPGVAPDRRNIDAVAEYFHLHRDLDEHLDGCSQLADVALVHSRLSQDRFGSDDPFQDGYVGHVRGWELALMENHVLYTIVPDTMLTDEMLARYKVVILPNCAVLSEEAAAVIRRFVDAGGSLISTFETSLYDENFNRRPNFLLADVMGVTYQGLTRGPYSTAYLWLREGAALAEGFGDTSMTATNGRLCHTRVTGDTEMAVTFVPEIIPQHPERAWVENMELDIPVVTQHQFGAGRVVYFANQMDRLFVADGHPDYGRYLGNALRWCLGRPSVDFAAPTSVYLHGTQNRDKTEKMFHLINVSGGPRRPLAVPLEVRELVLTIPGAAGNRAEAVTGGEIVCENQGEDLKITIPSLAGEYMVIRIRE